MQEILRYAYNIVLFTINRYFSYIEAANLQQTLTVQSSLNGTSTTHIFAQGCFISREICLFPRRQEILGNTGKYKISNNELLVNPVVGMLTLEVDQIRY